MCLLPQYEQVAITDITEQLQEANLFNKPGILQTVWVLHGLIDKEQTVTINGVKHKRGATCPVAQETIAGMIGVNRRATAHGYLKELVDAGILRVEKASIGGKNCYRYIFTIFDLYAQEPETCTDEDESVRENEKPVRLNDETCTPQSVHNQEDQDIQEPPLNVSSGPGPNEVSEKRGGDSINHEKQEKVSLREKDIVPNAGIGKTREVDELVGAILGAHHQNHMKPPEDGIESFVDLFNEVFGLESVGVMSQAYVEPALELQKVISSKLSAAGLSMSVNLFLEKYLAHCVQESLGDGTLEESPRAFGFFLRMPKGQQVLERSMDMVKVKNSVDSNVARTAAYVEGLKDRKLPSESEKQKISEIVSDIKPMTPEESKEYRRQRRAS